MAKPKPKVKFVPPPVKGKPNKFAKGKMTPEQMAKLKHAPNAVLGHNDTTYHNC